MKNQGELTNIQKDKKKLNDLTYRIAKVGGVHALFKATKKIKAPQTITNYLKPKAVFEKTEPDIIQALATLESLQKDTVK